MRDIAMQIYYTEPSVWFQKGKPTVDPSGKGNFSNTRYFRTLRKARQMARGILDRWPNAEVEIFRPIPESHGKREKYEVWKRKI